jgi:DNA processing protein
MLDRPQYVARDALLALRGDRGFPAVCEGLWACGSLEGLRQPTVAIVGTRAATLHGRRLAREIAAGLARAGCAIISGLALGIDAAGHEGALEGGGATIGILGGGHRCFFPRRNRELADRMLRAGGAVVSPFPPDQAVHPGQFLQRNGIVAALADALLVLEAPARSGALNTASWAAGRIPVLAVPGDVDRPAVQGCLALLRDGATLARHAADVLEALGLPARLMPTEPIPGAACGDPRAAALLTLLAGGEADIDSLAGGSGEEIATVLTLLSTLELEGRIERRGGTRYALAQ